MTSPSNITYICFSFLSVVLLILPSAWHWRARNTGTLLIIGWGVLGNMCGAISAIIFAQSAENVVPGWCDFAGQIGVIYGTGVTAGSLCLLRRLESIASTRQAMQTPRDKRRRIIIDLLVGIGFPLLLLPLRYVAQGHRMDIIEEIGCSLPLYISLPSIFLYQIWPLVLSLVSLVYAVLALRWFLIRRRQFNAVLHSSNSGLTCNKYIRLMAMAAFEMLFSFPVGVYLFAQNFATGGALQPYVSWNYVHEDWDTTYSYPRDAVDPATFSSFELSRWTGVVVGLIFFAFFGLSPEAIREYRGWADKIAKTTDLPRSAKETHQPSQSHAIGEDNIARVATMEVPPTSPSSGKDFENGWDVSTPQTPKEDAFGMSDLRTHLCNATDELPMHHQYLS